MRQAEILKGERVYLRFYTAADSPFVQALLADPEIARFYLPGLPRPYAPDQVTAELNTWHGENEAYLFAIVDRADESVIGLANLDQVDLFNRNAEVGIGLAAAGRRRSGLGQEALTLLIDYAFYYMNMHRLYARVIDGNQASLRLFKKLGFSVEGRLRAQVFRNGLYLDMHMFGLLEKEWSGCA